MDDRSKTFSGRDLDADWGLVVNASVRDRLERLRITHRERLERFFLGRVREPRTRVTGVLEPPPEEGGSRIGICCSGGGIRSASFNLGALQHLQQRGRLEDAKYLSAVSGGSYIASAFAMVAKNVDTGEPDPPGDDSSSALVRSEAPPFYEGSPEEQYLRNHLSYLAPHGRGKVLLVWRIFLGLLVNLVLIGAAVMLAGALLGTYYESAHPGLDARPATTDANPDLLAFGAAVGGLGLALGLALVLAKQLSDGARRFLELWSLRLCLGGAAIVFAEAVLPALIAELRSGDRPGPVQVGGGFTATVAAIVSAVVVHARARFADPVDAIRDAKKGAGRFSALPARLRAILIYAAATVAGPLLVFGGLVAAVILQITVPDDWQWLPAAIAALVFGGVMYYGDLTSWSLHPFYRRRLCTAFALKRVRDDDSDPIGYAAEREQGDLVPLSDTAVIPREDWRESKQWPALIVCAAANVSDPGATPPGRGVTSFTFSAHALGGPLVGGIPTRDFEDALPGKRRRDFTLPAAVAMSGAALSPSMGKMTRPSIRFLLALANVRLGVWVANPRRIERFVNLRDAVVDRCKGTGESRLGAQFKRIGSLSDDELNSVLEHAWRRAARDDKHKTRRPRPHYLLKELLGLNSINDPFLYVSDGGHYENLGLVELLRRGCTHVYCFDASGGEPLAALGDAVALARSELGVEITFPEGELDKLREADGFAEAAVATGSIWYPGRVVGRIVYAPTVMTRKLPIDVQAFRVRDEHFPRHSTLDQFFTDQKFEAYRVLGVNAARAAVEAMEAESAEAGPPMAPRTMRGVLVTEAQQFRP